MRIPLILSVLVLLGAADLSAQQWNLTRSQKALWTWIVKHFDDRDTVTLRPVLSEARRIGWIQNAADHRLLEAYL